MSLDGLRAWIGVVERKLTMRTRVFLVLVAIAIGGAAAGIVLAIDAQDSAVSKDDLENVRDELAGTSAPAETPDAIGLETEVEALREEVAALRGEGEGGATRGAGSSPEAGGGGEGPSGDAPAPSDQKEREEAFERFKQEGAK